MKGAKMLKKLPKSLFVICLLTTVLSLSACDSCDKPLEGVVTITYRQLFNFNEWEVRATDCPFCR
jgi:hypothetical protein